MSGGLGQLATSAGGAGIGFLVGGPTGASIGWLAGSIVGGMLFPAEGLDSFTEGPRLGDLSVISSAYGAPIPVCYGTQRLSGNIIWSTGKRETPITVSQEAEGGKGGGGGGATHTQTTYVYDSDFAMGFATDREAEQLVRMWFNGTLVYDTTNANFDATQFNVRFRFYKGTETQGQDPAIVANKGAANTPAHRGLTYIVFENFMLTNYGNNIPNITAEITFAGSFQYPKETGSLITGAPIDGSNNQNVIGVDYDRGVAYVLRFTNDATTGGIRRINLRTMTEELQVASADILDGGELMNGGITVMPTGHLVTIAGVSSNTEPIVTIDPNSLREVDRFGTSSASLVHTPTSFQNVGIDKKNSWMALVGLEGVQYYYIGLGSFNSAGLLEISGGGSISYIWDSDTDGDTTIGAEVHASSRGRIGRGEGEGWFTSGVNYGLGANSANMKLHKLAVSLDASFELIGGVNILSGVDLVTEADLTPSVWTGGAETELSGVSGIIYDPLNDALFFILVAPGNNFYLTKYKPGVGVVWSTLTGLVPITNSPDGWSSTQLLDNTFGITDGSDAILIDTVTGDIIYDSTEGGGDFNETQNGWMFYDSRNQSITMSVATNDFVRIYLGRFTGTGETVGTVVADLSARAGLSVGQINVTELTQLIQGYIIGRPMSVRAAISPLATFFLFDGVESDGVIDFKTRDRAATVSLTEADFVDTGGLWFNQVREQEVELPEKFSIVYMDRDNEYQQNTHNAKRITQPRAATFSKSHLTLTIPATLTAAKVKQTAEQLLYTAWLERDAYEFNLSQEHIKLDPADTVNITLDGATFKARVVKNDVGGGLTIDVTALTETAAQYGSTVAADGGQGFLKQNVSGSAATQTFIIDSPLLEDKHDVGRTISGLYGWSGGFGQTGWESAVIYKSDTGATFNEVARIFNEMAYGSTGSALPDTETPWAYDEVNTIKVYMTVGGDRLVSVTELQWLAGENACMLVDSTGRPEIILFQTVTADLDGGFTLSRLIRGMRGTELHTGFRAAGEKFILLEKNAPKGIRFGLGLNEIPSTRFYKGVGKGQIFETVQEQTLASKGRDLMPYHPVHFDAVEDATDIDFSWVRRTRVGDKDFVDLLEKVPLSEDTEEYEVDIYNDAEDTVLRTITGLTSEALTYTFAQMTTDFGGGSEKAAGDTIHAAVYQISAQVGRGFSEIESLLIG